MMFTRHSWLRLMVVPLSVVSSLVVACSAPAKESAKAPAATAAGTQQVIRSFDAQIKVNKDASLDITEEIKIDFGRLRKHGIFRIVPVQYERNGSTYTCDLRVQSITDQEERTLQHEDARQGRDINMRIGDPNQTVTGVNVYTLRYGVRRAVNFFAQGPEIYWNVTGDEWPFDMKEVRATLILPPGVAPDKVKATCFAGPPGSTDTRPIFDRGENKLIYECGPLKAGEGFTIVAGLPVGSLDKPGFWQELVWLLRDWWPLFVIPSFAMAGMTSLWYFSGRDEEGGKVAGVEWNPPRDLTPAEVGTLIDESCDMQDIISTLIDLAARGHLKIKQIKHTAPGILSFFSNMDYEFTKTDAPEGEKLTPHETMFLNGIFDYKLNKGRIVALSSLKGDFSSKVPAIKSAVYSSLMGKGLFVSNPQDVRGTYFGFAIGVGAIGWLVTALHISHRPAAYCIGFLLAAAIIAVFAPAMPARTAAGSRKTRESLGFQRFVRLAEKNRIRLLAKDDPTIFGRLLPYAMVLGAADQWAEAFEDLIKTPPDWYTPYSSGDGCDFSSRSFVDDLGTGMRDMERTFVAAPASSAGSGDSGFSGGSSGGGFGGGGGGSW